MQDMLYVISTVNKVSVASKCKLFRHCKYFFSVGNIRTASNVIVPIKNINKIKQISNICRAYIANCPKKAIIINVLLRLPMLTYQLRLNKPKRPK